VYTAPGDHASFAFDEVPEVTVRDEAGHEVVADAPAARRRTHEDADGVDDDAGSVPGALVVCGESDHSSDDDRFHFTSPHPTLRLLLDNDTGDDLEVTLTRGAASDSDTGPAAAKEVQVGGSGNAEVSLRRDMPGNVDLVWTAVVCEPDP
jgi:hypothetical protein